MEVVAEMFRSGGIWMYLVLALSLLVYPGLLVSGVLFGSSFREGAPRRKRRLIAGAIPLLGAVALVAVGVVGWQLGLAEAHSAMEMASPESRQRMLARGEQIAMYPLQAGAAMALIPGLVGLVFMVTGLLASDDGE